MRFDDIKNLPILRAATQLALDEATTYPVARAVILACHEAFKRGSNGLPNLDYVCDCDTRDLIHDAWHDGIIGRKLTIRLSSETDGSCIDCGNSVAHYATTCRCGSTEISRSVMVDVTAPFAAEWADWDGYIDGSSWDTPQDMPDYAYTILMDRPTLVEELRDEGYVLDLSEYTGES